MNSRQLNEAIGEVADRYLEEAENRRPPMKRSQRRAALAAAFVLVLTGGFFVLRGRSGSPSTQVFPAPTGSVRQLAAAVYPEANPYPILENYTDADGQFDQAAFEAAWELWWETSRASRQAYDFSYTEALSGFLRESVPQILRGADGENRVYAPKNLYLALAMLAETTGGKTREQALRLLGAGDTEALRTAARALWDANYQDDGTVTSVMASAVFLRDSLSYVQSTLDTLAADYYADAFSGEMGSADYDKTLQSWLDAHTGGLLTQEASGETLPPETVAALATTVWFRAKWGWQFQAEANTQDVFHAPAGDVTTTFMHHDEENTTYYWGERFSAVAQSFENFGGQMWLLLPDEGVSLDELLSDAEALRFLTTADKWRGWEKQKFLKVNLSLPKFDVVSDRDLAADLRQLGVTDAFDPQRADFSPLTDFSPVWVSRVQHAARVVIDEEGCTAAAFTVMPAAGSPPPPDEVVDFVLDRPFLFCVTGQDGLPLFVGVVNHP